jgi:hypothetical protein
MDVPKLSLSLGQVAWSLNFGQPPQRYLLDKLNYLRQLGIPFPKGKRTGRGNRVIYGYNDLIECGVALYALNNGMKQVDIRKILVDQRTHMRKLYRQALREQPVAALSQDWIKSMGRIIPILLPDIFLRLHDRYSETPWKIDVIGMDDVDKEGIEYLFDPVERYISGPSRRLVSLTRLALQWTAWALEAPEFRTGPKG